LSAYTIPDEPTVISLSGGRTSGYMLRMILDAHRGALPAHARVCFMNTGREMPETLDFVQEMSARWSVPVAWIEATGDADGFRVVDRLTASQGGEPFMELVQRRGILPNVVVRFCSTELKTRPLKKYMLASGVSHWRAAVGIRADEASRIRTPVKKERWTLWHPLADAGVTAADVNEWWARNDFDLRLPSVGGKTWLGNCDGCFLKSEAARAQLARDYPERAQWWVDMEAKMGQRFSRQWAWRTLIDYIANQGELALSTNGMLCQRDSGECSPHG
jgi:3'-phosphoadenosine 5'-phosphosulfate sulfotransferase (PAPS reductase)/FAD synthetase